MFPVQIFIDVYTKILYNLARSKPMSVDFDFQVIIDLLSDRTKQQELSFTSVNRDFICFEPIHKKLQIDVGLLGDRFQRFVLKKSIVSSANKLTKEYRSAI